MPRQNRRSDSASASGSPIRSVGERRESWRGEDYVVRSVTGSGSTSAYRCPGCDQEIRPVSPHVVVWPAHDLEAGHRRHWHKPCWAARERRMPGAQRGRSAPRY